MPLIAGGASTAVKRQQEPVAPQIDPDEIRIPWPTTEEAVKHFRGEFDEVIRFRAKAISLDEEITFLAEQLANPDLADHPKRGWAVRRHESLVAEQDIAFTRMLTSCYHMTRTWQGMMPAERKRWKLDTMIGIDADAPDLRDLPDLLSGPIQDEAPAPEGWTLPADLRERVPPNIAIALNIAPF